MVITRQKVSFTPVSFQPCGSVSPRVASSGPVSKVGYIRIATFNSQTTAATRDAIQSLQESGADR